MTSDKEAGMCDYFVFVKSCMSFTPIKYKVLGRLRLLLNKTKPFTTTFLMSDLNAKRKMVN